MLDLPRLLHTVDLVSLVQQAGVELRLSGSGWRGRCPLHNGNNATAFVVYESDDGRQRWYCHADCGQGGDAVDFVRRWEGLPDDREGFWEAVRYLAAVAGQPLESFQGGEGELSQARTDSCHHLLNVAARHYQAAWNEHAGETGRRYARGRGWGDETILSYLGYSTGRLRAYLEQQGADLQEALAAGLLRQRDDGLLVDVIPEGYLVYLHHDGHGRITYLSGRATFTDEPTQKARNLHAPRHLFRVPSRPRAPLVVVEGQADALTVHEWGYGSVALCGATLQARDVQQLRRYTPLYLSLDADAATRLPLVATALGPLTLIVAPSPVEKDLNGWHQQGGTREAFADHLARARPWIDVAMEQAVAAPLFNLAAHLDQLAVLVSDLPHSLWDRYLDLICSEYRLTSRRAFQQLLHDQKPAPPPSVEVINHSITREGRQITNFVATIVSERVSDKGERYLSVRGTLHTGEALPEIELSSREFEEGNWVLRHWGSRPCVYLPPRKRYLLQQAIQELAPRREQVGAAISRKEPR